MISLRPLISQPPRSPEPRPPTQGPNLHIHPTRGPDSRNLQIKELFQIGLVYLGGGPSRLVDLNRWPNSFTLLIHPTHSSKWLSLLMDPTCGALKQGVVPDWTFGSSTRGRCFITHGPSLWSLKNKELFRIGLTDCPCMGVDRLLDLPRVEP